MRQHVTTAFVLLALLSIPALAEEPRGAEDRQSWLVGGGIGYRLGDAPTPRVSIERWFSPRFALGLGVEHVVYRTESSRFHVNSARGISGEFGARAALTPSDAAFRLAVVVLGTAGFVKSASYVLAAGSGAISEVSTLSLSGGLSIEKRLSARWWVRLQIQPLRVRTVRVQDVFLGGAIGVFRREPVDTVSVDLGLNAALELRFEL
jgi:hypothetical protein